MVAKDTQYELDLPATPAAVSTARQEISKFAAALGADREKVALAVSEAVANAVVHAYSGNRSGSIRLRAWAEDDAVRVAVLDQGPGLGSTPGRKPGLGLPLMRFATDALSVISTKLGVEVAMAFDRHRRDKRHESD